MTHAIALLKADRRQGLRSWRSLDGACPERSRRARTRSARDDRRLVVEVLEAYEEHGVAKMLIRTIEQTDPKDGTYSAKLQVLGEMIAHHVKEEENEMFKQARSLLSEDNLVELGEEITAMKEAEAAQV